MKIREIKSTDQEQTQRAYELLYDLILNNQNNIDPTLWVGAMICALADNFKESGVSFDCFKKDIISAIDHYRY